MTDLTLDETQDSFLFREPPGFFDEFERTEGFPELLLAPLLALRANLHSAIMVGVIPFQLAHSGVLENRFTQLIIATKIHQRRVDNLPESEDEKERLAFKNANEEMNSELSNPEIIKRHALATLNVLQRHLKQNDFRMSAQELLRQIVVMCWGAFEIAASDALRLVLNGKPNLFRSLAETKPYRDAFSNRVIIEALEMNGFDLSRRMGDLFCNEIRVDSLEKIRDVYRLILEDSSVDSVLKNELLWKIFQQRNLIVHRRGLIDSWYLEHTSDTGTIGAHIVFQAPYIEACLNMVRDAGLSVIKGCRLKLNTV